MTLQPTLNQHSRALTGGLIMKYKFDTENAAHTLSAAVRGRQSRALRETLPNVSIGRFDTTNLKYPERPITPGPISSVNSDVDQVIGSMGYGGIISVGWNCGAAYTAPVISKRSLLRTEPETGGLITPGFIMRRACLLRPINSRCSPTPSKVSRKAASHRKMR